MTPPMTIRDQALLGSAQPSVSAGGTWELITQAVQPSDAVTFTANFTDVDFADVSCFVVSFQGTDGVVNQGSSIQIGTSSGVISSGNDYQALAVYVGDSSHFTNVGYTYTVNGNQWYINNSWSDPASFPMIYIWGNPITDNPQMQMNVGSETTWLGTGGYLDATLTSLGEVKITGTGTNDIKQDSRLQVYKVTK